MCLTKLIRKNGKRGEKRPTIKTYKPLFWGFFTFNQQQIYKMKNLFILFLMAAASAGAQSISFIKNDWEKAREEAARTKKYLLVDCYTDWCYWCKVMDSKTFPDKKVAEFVSTHFVAAKLEMEHGYGVTVAAKYNISGFPSFLILTPDGRLVSKLAGYSEPSDFLNTLQAALDTSQSPVITGVSATVDLAFPDFYKQSFTGYSGKRKFPTADEVNAYMAKQNDIFSEINYNVLLRFASLLKEEYRNALFDSKQKLEKMYCRGEVDEAIGSVANNLLNTAIKDTSIEKLNATLEFIDKHLGQEAESRKNYFQLTYYLNTGNWVKMLPFVNAFIEKNGYEANYLNEWAWAIYEKCSDKEIVKKAATWMKPVIEKSPAYASTDTYAALLYKCGDYEKAEKYAKLAINLGKAADEKTTETEALLKKIEGALQSK